MKRILLPFITIFLCASSFLPALEFEVPEVHVGGAVQLETSVYERDWQKYGWEKQKRLENNFEEDDFVSENKPKIHDKFFTDFKFGDTNLYFTAANSLAGAKFSIWANHFTQNALKEQWYATFTKDSFIWVKFLNLDFGKLLKKPVKVPSMLGGQGEDFAISLKVQFGEFESRSANLINSAIDKWTYGGFWYATTNNEANNGTNAKLSNLIIIDNDLFQNLVVSLGAGPFTLEYSPFDIYEISDELTSFAPLVGDSVGYTDRQKQSLLSLGKTLDLFPYNKQDKIRVGTSARLSSARLFNGWFRFVGTYGLTVSELARDPTKTTDFKNSVKKQYINRVSAIGEVYFPFNLTLTAGYSWGENQYYRAWENRRSTYKTDIMHAADLRLQWKLLDSSKTDRFIIEAHSKIAFNSKMAYTVKDDYMGVDEFYVPNEKGLSNLFATFNGLGMKFYINEYFTLDFLVADRFVKFTNLSKINEYYDNELRVESFVTYNITKNAFVKAGFTMTFEKRWALENGVEYPLPDGAGGVHETFDYPYNGFNFAIPITVKIALDKPISFRNSATSKIEKGDK